MLDTKTNGNTSFIQQTKIVLMRTQGSTII